MTLEKRTEIRATRLTESEAEAIDQFARVHDISVSDLLRTLWTETMALEAEVQRKRLHSSDSPAIRA